MFYGVNLSPYVMRQIIKMRIYSGIRFQIELSKRVYISRNVRLGITVHIYVGLTVY